MWVNASSVVDMSLPATDASSHTAAAARLHWGLMADIAEGL